MFTSRIQLRMAYLKTIKTSIHKHETLTFEVFFFKWVLLMFHIVSLKMFANLYRLNVQRLRLISLTHSSVGTTGLVSPPSSARPITGDTSQKTHIKEFARQYWQGCRRKTSLAVIDAKLLRRRDETCIAAFRRNWPSHFFIA